MSQRQASFWATVKAVLWSFLGVRKRSAYHEDAESLNPLAVIITGVVGGILFVLLLVGFIQFVVMS